MQFNSVSEFFAMGGYGYFVWMSFGVTALVLGMEVMVVKRRQQQALTRLATRLRLAAQQGDRT